MVNIVTTKEVRQISVINFDSFKDRDKVHLRLKKNKSFIQKDGLFGADGDYSIGSDFGSEIIPVIRVYCQENTEKHDKILSVIQKFLAENIKTNFSAETKIEYVR